MFSKFDKALGGGVAAWLTQGIVAGLETIGLPDVPDAMEVWIATAVGALVVWLVPNKA